MVSDVPFVSYKKKKDTISNKKAMDDLSDRWHKKHSGKAEKVSLSDYVRKDVLKS